MKKQQWQDNWPTESGMWWFYGWCWKKSGTRDEPELPEIHLVNVRETAVKGSYMLVTNGHFLYKQEGAEGKWMKATLPTPPEGVNAR